MNALDIGILVVLAFFLVKGLIRGIIVEVFTLLGWIIGFVVALREKSILASWMIESLRFPELLANILGFLVILFIIVFLFRWAGRALKFTTRWTFIGWLDRGGGVLFGVAKGLLVASLLLALFTLVPLPDSWEEQKQESILFEPVEAVAPAIFNFLQKALPKTKDFYEEIREGFTKEKQKAIDKMKKDALEKLQKEIEKQVGKA
jgi:membrane protein required for colicin V production